jgi:hypothetical protein
MFKKETKCSKIEQNIERIFFNGEITFGGEMSIFLLFFKSYLPGLDETILWEIKK